MPSPFFACSEPHSDIMDPSFQADRAETSAANPDKLVQLNARSWVPAQVTSTGRLQAAPLQFALGSQLLLDETVLTGGQLAATGIHNFQVILTAMASGKSACNDVPGHT